MYLSLPFPLLLLALLKRTVSSHHLVGFRFYALAEGLNKGISDLTATKDEVSDMVYLAGGCDSPNGNELSGEYFACKSISDSLILFDHSSESFNYNLPKLPRARYRHAALIMDRHLWLVGGRDLEDTLIREVDVFDIENNLWLTFYDLPENYAVSDLAGFPNPNNKSLIFCGGYDQTYQAQSACFVIDTIASLTREQGKLNLTILESAAGPIPVPRGDISILPHEDGALMTGGFSHLNDFCAPYNNTDEFLFSSNEWSHIATMSAPRGDKILVELKDHIFAIGGETKPEGLCSDGSGNEAGRNSLSVDDIEEFDRSTNTWKVIAKLPDYRFRFAAVAFDDFHTIYSFGGQLAYSEDCKCYRTTNEVVAYKEKFDDDSDDDDNDTESNPQKNSGDDNDEESNPQKNGGDPSRAGSLSCQSSMLALVAGAMAFVIFS
jgi:hypothetical protein